MPNNFLPYMGYAYFIRRKSKMSGLKTDLRQFMAEMAARCNMYNEQTDCATALFEMVHYNVSHKVVNVASNLAERLLSSRMTIQIENLTMPWTVFEICFEKGFKIPGTDLQMPSCMIIYKLDEQTKNAMRVFMKDCGEYQKQMINELRAVSGQGAINQVEMFINPDLERLFSIKYRDPLKDWESAPLCHCNIDLAKCAGKTVDEVIDNLPLIEHAVLVTAMDERDKAIQKQVLTVVLGTLCYLNVNDPDIATYKFKDRPRMGILPSAQILGASFDKMPPGYHLREPHFRWLKHERFKREQDGTPRVIWVRPTEVGVGRDAAKTSARKEHELESSYNQDGGPHGQRQPAIEGDDRQTP